MSFQIQPPLRLWFEIATSRILRHAPEKLFGREAWLGELDRVWEQRNSKHVFTLVAWGGVGKTSLVAHWVQQRFAATGWPGVERYFDWSFYSQGTGESRQTSSDLFIKDALTFFGDQNPTAGGPWERGERLARLVRKRRTLLVLDGIEPLQYPENDPSGQGGMLKDDGLAALLQGLAADNPGLCVVTTREPLANLKMYNDSTAPERRLDELPCDAAVDLLRHLLADSKFPNSEDDLQATWKEAGGHALTLQLLGSYLHEAHGGDIRKLDVVDFQAADRETQGRSAFKVMAAYERWLSGAGDDSTGVRMLAILRLTGLFDRPISPDCLAALRKWHRPNLVLRLLSRKARQIDQFVRPITGLTDAQWNTAITRLETLDLISLTSTPAPRPSALAPQPSLDAHPLIREYFAEQLRTQQPKAFQAAHGRLFDHLCESTEHRSDKLDGLQPLYQAVVHGCLAGRHQDACADVYRDRILRGTGSDGNYSTFKLGAIGSDLSAVAAFFDLPWSRVSPNLSESDQAWLLNEAAFRLRALGRLTEALDPMRAGLEKRIEQKAWINCARFASNLSELEVTLGRLESAVADARLGIDFADRSGDAFLKMVARTTVGDALHQSGEWDAARDLFVEAERLQKERQPQFDLLYSLQGFRFCDLLLAPGERAAWRVWLDCGTTLRVVSQANDTECRATVPLTDDERTAALDACTEAERRGTQTLEWVTNAAQDTLSPALDSLTRARAALYASLLRADASGRLPAVSFPQPLTDAVNGLRRAGQIDYILKGLLTAAGGYAWRGERKPAVEALNEALQIAQRGPMPLYEADVLLTRARLFGFAPIPTAHADKAAAPTDVGPVPTGRDDENNISAGGNRPYDYPWDSSPEEDLKQARQLIEHHGYGRRLPELEDAEAAFGITPAKPEN